MRPCPHKRSPFSTRRSAAAASPGMPRASPASICPWRTAQATRVTPAAALGGGRREHPASRRAARHRSRAGAPGAARRSTSATSRSISPTRPSSIARSTRSRAPSRPAATMTYGEIAKRLGVPHESREVGQALGRNPIAIIVPCHRVLGADGKMGGFSAIGRRRHQAAHPADRGRRRAVGGPVVRAAMAGFGFDPKGAVAHLRKADPALAEVIGAVGPFAMQLESLAQPVRRAGRGDRLSAAVQQGRGHHLRPHRSALSRAPRWASRRRTSSARPTRSCAAPACRAPRCWRCAILREKVATRRAADARRGASARRRRS